MDDGVIRIGTQVDVSGIKAGMAEASAAVKSSSSQIEAAYQKLGAATAEYAVTQTNLRAVTKQLVDGTVSYTMAQKALTPAIREQVDASKALAAAKAELIAAEKIATGAVEAENAAVHRGISEHRAAAAAMRELEGNFKRNTRAADQFLISSLHLGPALQMAFPLVGAVAFAGIIFEVAESMVKFTNDASELATQTGTGWLDGAIGQFDGLKEAAKEADEEMMAIAKDMDSLREKGQNLDIEKIRLIQGEGAAYRAQAEQEKAYIKTQQDILGPMRGERGTIQKQLTAADIRRSSITGEEVSMSSQGFMTPSQIAQARLHLEELDRQMQSITGHIGEANKQIEVFGLEAQKADEAAAKKESRSSESAAKRAAAEAKRAQEEKIRADREGLDAAKSVHAMTANEEAQYWVNVAGLARYRSLEYTTAVDEANKAIGRSLQKSAEELKNYDFSTVWDQAQKASEDQKKRADELSLAISESESKVQQAHNKTAAALEMANVRAAEASGGMNALAVAHATAAIHAREYREELERIDAEITKLGESESTLSPAQRNQKMGQLQAQKIGIQGAAATTGVQDAAAIQQRIQSPYLKAFNSIESGWMKAQDEMLRGTKTVGASFAQMGANLTISAINSIEQMALKAVEKDLMMMASNRIMNQSKVATQAQTDAEASAIHHTSAMKDAIIDSKSAAVKGWKAGWDFPFPANLVMAPVLAGVALAGAIAQFEDGSGYIPRTGMAMLHQGEAVIPAPTMQELRGGSGGAGDVTIHQQNTWNSMTDSEFQRQLDRHAAHVAGAVKKHMRQGGR